MKNGFMNKIIGLVLVLVIGATLVGGLLVPSITAAQQNVGDVVTFKNGGSAPIFLDYYDEDFTLTIDASNKTATVGSYTVNTDASTPRIMFWEYGRINLNATNQPTAGGINDYRTGQTLGITDNATIVYDYSEHTLSLTMGDTTAQFTAYTVMAIKENGKYVFQPSAGMGNAYYSDSAIQNKTLGYLDAVATYNDTSLEVVANKNGAQVYGLPEGTEYTVSVGVLNGTLVEGTTNVYQNGTPVFTITIGEDTITTSTYRFGQAVLYEIKGNADSGANYAIFGVISLFGIVLLVTIAAGAIRSKY